jgi:hypothetical protein
MKNLNPKNEIQALIQQAKNLRSQAEQVITSRSDPILPVIGEIALKSYVPHGYKSTARKIGSKALKRNKDQLNRQWREQGDKFSKQCMEKIKNMSINTSNLKLSGNSQKLITKFNRTKRIKTALSFFDNLISVLEEIETLDLIWNYDIANEIKKRQSIKEDEKYRKEELKAEAKKIIKEARQIELIEKSQILTSLKDFPRVQHSLSAAFDRLQDISPDAPRHCIVSCRVGLEQFCMDAGESDDWKKGLCNIFSSNTDRRQIKHVNHYLSGKGAHGGHDPNKTEAEYCLKITIASLETMLKEISK